MEQLQFNTQIKFRKKKKRLFNILRKSSSGVVNFRLLRHNVLKDSKWWIVNGLGVALINELLIQIYSLALNISRIYISRFFLAHHPRPLNSFPFVYPHQMNRFEIRTGMFNRVKGLNELFESIRIFIWI